MESRRVIDLTELDLSDLVRKVIREEKTQTGEDRWLTTKEAADYLGKSVNALHILTSRKQVPFHRDGPNGKLYFRKSELDEWRMSNA